MKSTELAFKFQTIYDKLLIADTYEYLLSNVLNNYGPDISYEKAQTSIAMQLTHLDRTVYGYTLNEEYTELIELFGFTKFINHKNINELISQIYRNKTTHQFITNHIAYKELVRLLTFLQSLTNTNNALQKLLVIDKKIQKNENTSELLYTIADQESGYDIEYVINTLSSIKSLYSQTAQIEGDKTELKIEYFDSGSSIIIAFIGSLPVIKYVLKIIDLYYNIRYKKLEKSIEHFKQSIELKEWIDNKVNDGTITQQQADSAILDIFTKLDSLHGFNLSNFYQNNLYLLENEDIEMKQLPDPDKDT